MSKDKNLDEFKEVPLNDPLPPHKNVLHEQITVMAEDEYECCVIL